ncbi:MAG: hypothetical protein WEC36_00840 [Phycisphaeraceae bacterium]
MRRWLADFACRAQAADRWIVAAATQRYGADPAFIQCLRLLVKEERHLAELTQRLLSHCHCPTRGVARVEQMSRPVRSALGVRFEVSIMLLGALIDIAVCRTIRQSTSEPLLVAVLGQIVRDREAHVAFASEWLTLEFADFNFVRRNLRRARLRAMFTAMMAHTVASHSPLLDSLGCSRLALARACWSTFQGVLERMVPYRRDVLLATLLEQKERPYAETRLRV